MKDKPQLPGHIQAAIDRNLAKQNRDAFGRPADSAGATWDGRDLTGPGIDGSANPLHAFDTDDGLEDEAWTKISQDLVDGRAGEKDVFKVLENIRVFAAVVPTVAKSAVHTHIDEDGKEYSVEADKEADVALVSLKAADGRGALPVFTSIPKLTAWHKNARPVAVWMPRACLSAVDEGNELVVIDPGAHLTYVVRRPEVYALAQQQHRHGPIRWRHRYQQRFEHRWHQRANRGGGRVRVQRRLRSTAMPRTSSPSGRLRHHLQQLQR